MPKEKELNIDFEVGRITLPGSKTVPILERFERERGEIRQAVIKITFKLLREALKIPDDIAIEGVFMTVEDFQANTFTVKVNGERLGRLVSGPVPEGGTIEFIPLSSLVE